METNFLRDAYMVIGPSEGFYRYLLPGQSLLQGLVFATAQAAQDYHTAHNPGAPLEMRVGDLRHAVMKSVDN